MLFVEVKEKTSIVTNLLLLSRRRCNCSPSETLGSSSGMAERPAFLQSTVTTPGALVHLQGSGHPTVSGHVREAIGKSLRRTFEEGELKKEEERGVSFKLGSPSWQAIVEGS